MIAVADSDFVYSDEKCARIAWRDHGKQAEAPIRKTSKENPARLDATHFAQGHSTVAVNLRTIDRMARGGNKITQMHLRRRSELLPASRNDPHLFRQM